jgi:hypothetical protein
MNAPIDVTAISTPSDTTGPGGVILMLESAYVDGDYTPDHTHTTDHIDEIAKHWHNRDPVTNRYLVKPTSTRIVQAVLECDEPDNTKIVEGFRSRNTGIANFIGPAAANDKRPSAAQVRASAAAFRPWLNKYRPGHLLVCSTLAWNAITQSSSFPGDHAIIFDANTRAYRLDDGSWTICHSTVHPRNVGWPVIRSALDELMRLQVMGDKLVRCGAVGQHDR